LDAINHALEEAWDDLTVPTSHAGKVAKTPVKKVGVLGVSFDLGDELQRRALPASAALRLDALVTRLAKQHKRQILLTLDEVQTMGEASDQRLMTPCSLSSCCGADALVLGLVLSIVFKHLALKSLDISMDQLLKSLHIATRRQRCVHHL